MTGFTLGAAQLEVCSLPQDAAVVVSWEEACSDVPVNPGALGRL